MTAARSPQEMLERIEHLEHCLAQITEPPPEMAERLAARDAGGGQQTCRIFGALAAREGQVMSREQLMYAMYYDRPDTDWPEDKVMNVLIHRLRPRLRDVGLGIESVYGIGYRLVRTP